MKTLIVQILFIISVNCIYAQQTIHIKADYDAAIGYHDGYSTNQNNYGNAEYCGSYCYNGTHIGYNVNRALIHFDLSSIPQSAEIQSAYISLYGHGPIGNSQGHEGTANTSYLKMVTESWNENTVTWDNQPTTSTDYIVTLHQSVNSTEDYINIEITDMVKAWYENQAQNFGVLMGLFNEVPTNSLVFCSTEYSDSNKYPVLKIVYSDCNPREYRLYSYKDAAIGYHDGLNTANNNYGDADYIAGYCMPGTNYGLNVNRGVFYFDFSTIPNSAELLSAKLSLYAKGQSGTLPGHVGSTNSIVLQRIIENWSEYTVTWNNQPNTTNANEVVLPQSGNSLQDYTNIDVTDIVRDMIQNPTVSFGFLMKLQTEVTSNAMIFCSTDYPDSAKWPVLKLSICNKTAINDYGREDILLNIFPNPATSDVTCSFLKDNSDDFNILIANMQGQLVYSKDFGQTEPGIFSITINIENLTDGLYLVLYKSKSGQSVKRLVIQR